MTNDIGVVHVDKAEYRRLEELVNIARRQIGLDLLNYCNILRTNTTEDSLFPLKAYNLCRRTAIKYEIDTSYTDTQVIKLLGKDALEGPNIK